MKSFLPATSVNSATAEKFAHSRAEAAVDTMLVQRFLSGDETAFVEIMDRYRAKIFAATQSLLRNHSDAEEITQDTFIRAYRGLAKFRGDSSLATWLYRISVNLARNRYWYMFRRRRQDSVSLDFQIGDDQSASFADLIAADTSDPAQESARAEFSDLVTECMNGLEPGHREILTMRNLLHHSYDEISANLGINVGTVKSRIARAREKLHALIAERCPEFAGGRGCDDYFLPSHGVVGIALAAA